jgi:PAS domain S-box-containing protein
MHESPLATAAAHTAHQVPDAIYRAMVQQAEDALLILDGITLIECNRSAERLYGASSAQLRGQSLIDCSPPLQPDGGDSAIRMNGYLERVLGGEAQRFEWMHSRPDGGSFLVELALSRWDDGDVTQDGPHVIGVVRCIDEERRIARDLDEKKLELQALLENFPGGVSIVNHALRVVAWNQEMLRLTDLSEDVLPPGTTPDLLDVFRYNIARGEYGEQHGLSPEQQFDQLAKRARSFQPHRFERTRPNGTVLEVRGAPTSKGGFVTIYQDVTEQFQMKEQLRKQSLLLQEVIEHMPGGITVFDETLHLQLWNTDVLEMLDLPPDCMVKGVAFEDLLRIMIGRGEYGVVDVEQDVKTRMEVVRKFKEHRYERTSPNGRTFLIHGKPLNSDGKLVEFITTLTDITDRKQAEVAARESNLHLEQLVKELREARADLIRSERLAALGSLVGGMAHELNTPLGNCLMMMSGMQEMTGALAEKVACGSVTRDGLIDYMSETADASNLIMRNLSNAADLIRHFKQVAINEAGSQRACFNLRQLCGEIISPLKKMLMQSGHMITQTIPLDIEMNSYPGPFEQVIVNLVNNAILHAFEGCADGRMHLSASHKQPDRVLIEFRDDGVGIPAANLHRIFDPFFTTKPGRGGTGLGLSISYNIVTSLLGGQISAVSTPGKGTTFILDLPLKAPQH